MSVVYVGSTSPIKIGAVEDSLPLLITTFNLSPTVTVVGLSASSNVSRQPVGLQEIIVGAQNRAHESKRLQPTGELWVGIENGLVLSKEWKISVNDLNTVLSTKWVDVGFIWIEGKDWSFPIITKPLFIPDQVLRDRYGDDYEELHRGTSTNWSDDKDPHAIFSSKSRKSFLAKAIKHELINL